MNWFSKKSIKHATQAFLLIFSSLNGFFWLYLTILFKISPNINGWAILASILLSGVSTYGLFYWINNN
jgi:hypothetical protein